MIRGGMEFKPGRPILIPHPPDSIHVEHLELWCTTHPLVKAGDRVTTGQVLAEADPGRTGQRLSAASGVVRQVQESKSPDGKTQGHWLHIETEARAESTTLRKQAPAGRKLSTWLDALHEVGVLTLVLFGTVVVFNGRLYRRRELPDLGHAGAQLRVIEAHRVLMDMNERNRETFQDLVSALEAEEANSLQHRNAS